MYFSHTKRYAAIANGNLGNRTIYLYSDRRITIFDKDGCK